MINKKYFDHESCFSLPVKKGSKKYGLIANQCGCRKRLGSSFAFISSLNLGKLPTSLKFFLI